MKSLEGDWKASQPPKKPAAEPLVRILYKENLGGESRSPAKIFEIKIYVQERINTGFGRGHILFSQTGETIERIT